ncbi:TonB-dependent copper receptor [Neisseria polysaccharea ATCC 43768]|uniref:TonB-dependent copper receptor n=1 Tax=Neisseria polysaccharea TaxID=489 RepID=UPI0001D9DD66|nr:TonB-dependent copper receptor [Neisseria polysaccharea]EFH22888.1 TonB-dependent copper receptor [Neisseria polysaccharea ATCC 43768]
MKTTHFLLLPLAAALSQAWAAPVAEETAELSPVTVTGTQQQKANTVKFNPKATLQPLPAGDGADLLQSVPNMSIIRKGGSSGDPLFRGLGGSRLAINADDQFVYGGCSNRMDPPTSYIHPSTFDEVVVTKGPQTVTQGMGLISGSVHFVRKDPTFHEQPYSFNGSTTLGSSGRRDAAFEAGAGGKYGYARLNVSHNESDDYKDGAGNRVHSNFKRDSQMVQLGVTPTENTTIAGTYERSRGKAAYADRRMDGSKFDRDAWNVRISQRNITPWLSEIEARYGSSEIDHVMDTYSLRTIRDSSTGMQIKKAINPKRRTDTGNLKATFDWDNVNLQTGIDYMRDRHTERDGDEKFTEKAYAPTQSFDQLGGFAEAAWQRNDAQKLIAGFRHDQVTGTYETKADSDPLKKTKYPLTSGFFRFEQTAGNTKYYAGLGIAQRAPDYWERKKSENLRLRKETNRQLDAGLIWNSGNWHVSASVFAGKVDDFIIVEPKPMTHHTAGSHTPTTPAAGGHSGHHHGADLSARNIDAIRLGGELEVKWQFAPNWSISSNLAYTYGKNRTDGKPLAQTPPLEWNNTLAFDNGKFSAGALWKLVAKQNRYAKGQGNIIGQDIGASAGFGVLSVNAGWKFNKYATLQGGVDNVFNKTYAEFVSRSGGFVDPAAGIKTTRVNEPGRTAWLRLQAKF